MQQKIIIILLFSSFCLFSQQKKSKGDLYFFEKNYPEAIVAYKKEGAGANKLRIDQYLNLATSYYKLKDYRNAIVSYKNVDKRTTTLPPAHVNQFLISLIQEEETNDFNEQLIKQKLFYNKLMISNEGINKEIISKKDKKEDKTLFFNLTINSLFDDNSATFYGDTLVFTSSRKEQESLRYFKLFKAAIDKVGGLSKVGDFTKTVDFPFHEAMPYYVTSQDKMFYGVSNANDEGLIFDKEGRNSISLAISNSFNHGDKKANYVLTDYSTSFYYPFYDDLKGRLYFSAELEDSYGGTDLYYVTLTNRIIDGKPINLGPKVNTPGNEISPFLFQGSLYFASDIYYGFGGMDMYKSEVLPNEGYDTPENLGASYNSIADDYGLIIRKQNDEELLGYFVSNKKESIGGDDLFGFRTKVKPGEEVVSITGKILNAGTKEGIEDAVVGIYKNGELIKETSSKEDGSYTVAVPIGATLALRITKAFHSTINNKIVKDDFRKIASKVMGFELYSLKDLIAVKESKVVLKSKAIAFQKSSAKFKVEVLDDLVNVLTRFPELKIKIENHTDSRGTKINNYLLSQDRAKAIKTYLVTKGISKRRISYRGFGETTLLNKCGDRVRCSEKKHQENNRTNFVISNAQELRLE